MISVTLKLTPAQFLVIHKFVWNTKLGYNNIFENGISELAKNMEDYNLDGLATFLARDLGEPVISFEQDEFGEPIFTLDTAADEEDGNPAGS